MKDTTQRAVDNHRINQIKAEHEAGVDLAIEMQQSINALESEIALKRGALALLNQMNQELDARLNALETPSYKRGQPAKEIALFGFDPKPGAYTLNTLTSIR